MKNEKKDEKKGAEKPKEEKPKVETQKYLEEFSIKTHTDSDFRFGKETLKHFGFGAKATLKVKILEIQKGKSVKLEITKA